MKLFLILVFFCVSSYTLQAQGKFKPEKNTLALKMSASPKKVKVGQKVYVQYPQHPSTGLAGYAKSSDEKVLKQVSEHTEYKNPQVEGMVGNDAATITVVFEAIASGSAEITCFESFRGVEKLLSKNTVKVTAK